MGPASASPQPALLRLRQSLAGIDLSLAPGFAQQASQVSVQPEIDTALGGGLTCGALHEVWPASSVGLGSASGFAAALAARASSGAGEVLWVATRLAGFEGGLPYGPGLEIAGLSSHRLLVLQVAKPVDVLWAMEEALRCRAMACVIAELTHDSSVADLTATRRLALAARDGMSSGRSGLGLLLRHGASVKPSAAATRWEIAPAPSEPDAYGGLGRARFHIHLCKNRRGPSGRWIVEWDHEQRAFRAPLSVAVAAAADDRSHRAHRAAG